MQAALDSPDRIDANRALELADSSNLKVGDLSKKDIKRLKKLKAMADEPIKLGESTVKLTKPSDEIAGIEHEL